MIVSDIMATKLITIQPDDTLSHAANLLRQYRFHHLPVVRTAKSSPPDASPSTEYTTGQHKLLFEGLLNSEDIQFAAALAQQQATSDMLRYPWQEQPVSELMHRATIRVSPTTSIASAARILVERDLTCLPVVEYEFSQEVQKEQESPVLVGLLTRSDLLLALAHGLGSNEPGMQINIELPLGNMEPLARTLLLAAELHVQIRNIIAVPAKDGVPLAAMLRLGTINPTVLLLRLRAANIQYTMVDSSAEGNVYA